MKMKKILKSKKGAVGIVTALTLVFLIGITGTSIDMSRSMIIKSKVASALDSASLAAGLAASRGVNLNARNPNGQVYLNMIGRRYYNLNYNRSGYLSSTDVDPVFTVDYTNKTVRGATNNIVVSQSFGGLSGVPTASKQNDPFVVNSASQVNFDIASSLDVSFVIDTSCSMQGEWGGTGEDRIKAARRILPGIVHHIYQTVESARIHAVAFDYHITKINDNDLGYGRNGKELFDQYNGITKEFMMEKNSKHAWRGTGLRKLLPNPANLAKQPYPGIASSNGFLSENFNTKAQGQVQMVTRMKRLRAPFRGCKTTTYFGMKESRAAFDRSPRPAGSPPATKVAILVYDGAPTMSQPMIDAIQDYNNARPISTCIYPRGPRGLNRTINVGGQPMTGSDLTACLNLNDKRYKERQKHRWEKHLEAYDKHQQECELLRSNGYTNNHLYSFYIGSENMSFFLKRDIVNDTKLRPTDRETLVNTGRVREAAYNQTKNTAPATRLKNLTLRDVVYNCSPNLAGPNGRRVFTPQNPEQFKRELKGLIDSLTKTRLTQ